MIIARADATVLPWRTASAQACVTSPPYLAQRRYGADVDELGQEDTLADYVYNLANALEEVRRVLRPDGLLWLNIGDKANASGGAGGDWSKAARLALKGQGPGKFRDPAYADTTFLDVPGAVLRELLQRRWRLRMPIVWNKGRQTTPESLTYVRRPGWWHEMIYMLSPNDDRRRVTPRFYPSQLTERGSVWSFPAGSDGDPHLAPFPDELARRCIAPSTLPGDLVIDPFHGSGTTGRVAEALGRRYAGTDLYAGPEATPVEVAS